MKPGETTGPQSMSQELLKVFSQIRLLEEQHHCSLNLTTALHAELLQAHARVRELEQQNNNPQQRNNNNSVVQARREVESLMKKFSQEKLAWKLKAKENLNTVQSQLEDERAARHRLENANRQLTKELIEAQSAATKAAQELERERKARQLIEEVPIQSTTSALFLYSNFISHYLGPLYTTVENCTGQSRISSQDMVI